MTSKHPKTQTPSDKSLREDPGIHRTKGAHGEVERLEGENTFEGDVLNDTTPQGGVDPSQKGRTNK